MTEVALYRIIIGAAGLLLIVAIWFIGRPRKPGQGRRVERDASGSKPAGGRAEPTLGETLEAEARKARETSSGQAEQARIEALERTLADDGKSQEAGQVGPLKPSFVGGGRTPQASQPTLGVRRDEQFDR